MFLLVIAGDLVGDRFLRRQVRTLVATAVAAASGHLDDDSPTSLLKACTSGRQELTAHPAPAEGLVFVAAGTDDELDLTWLSDSERDLLMGGSLMRIYNWAPERAGDA